MNTKERINKLDTILKDSKAPILKYFNPGLKRGEIDAFFNKNEIYPNQSLIDLYEWHNGTTFTGGVLSSEINILPFGSFFSLDWMMKKKAELMDWDIMDNPELFIPFMGSFEGEMFLVKNDPIGQVFYLSPWTMEYGELRFGSIDKMLDFIIECYDEKILTADSIHGLKRSDEYFDRFDKGNI